MHTFDPKKFKKLDNPERRKLLPPEKTLQFLNLKSGDKIADIGCGIGYFTIPAIKIVGKAGMVYGLDIQQELLNIAIEKTNEIDLDNHKFIHMKENNFILPNNSVNYALASLVLHEVENITVFLNEVKRILQPDGTLAIIEWQKKHTNDGPDETERLDTNKLKNILELNGYFNIESRNINSQMYAITANI